MSTENTPTPLTQGEQGQILTAAFDACPIRFHDRADTLAAIKADGREVHYEGGKAYITYDSEILPLEDALTRFGYDRRELCDGRTIPRTGVSSSRPGLASKADYATAGDKAKFISQFGLSAWEDLPLAGVTSSEVTTKADWFKLSVKEKVRRLAADPDAFSKLPEAPQEQKTSVDGMRRSAGAKFNDAGLERLKRINPSKR